jgi:hypothetical protein
MRTITIRMRAVDFAERIAAVRIWLDEHRFEPSRFKYSEDGDNLLIDVSFEVADEAAAFSARFNGGGTPHLDEATPTVERDIELSLLSCPRCRPLPSYRTQLSQAALVPKKTARRSQSARDPSRRLQADDGLGPR